MIYKDRVYGEIKISEPVILELIKSPAIQRLKGIDQAGYKKHWVRPETEMDEFDHTRFAHSVGVYILLSKYDAPLKEQVAGLIHDVSHSAFSHSIDYVLDAGSQTEHNHQDNIFEGYVKKTEIPKIFKKYNLDVEYILDDSNFPLLEKELPDLCADRIDYSLREAIIYGEISMADVDYFLENLIIRDNSWIFRDFESARKYAELFKRMNDIYFASEKAAIMFVTLGHYLNYALKNNYIDENDLYTDDKTVLNKIEKYLTKDKELYTLFNRLENKTIFFTGSSDDYDAHIFCKSRIVDPLFDNNGESTKVSKIEKSWADIVKKESMPKEYFIKFSE